jgi:formylglycine-generating enzyme required for sulfatase activity
MESMDRNQAFAFLGLPEDASHDDIIARVDARRRQLELRLQAAATPEQRKLLERALTELEEICALAMLDPRDPAAGLPGGATIILKSGTMLADRYVIKECLGTGERAAVFRALDLTWGREVALKVLLPDALLVPGIMERLAAVLRRTLGFNHSNLAGVYSLGRSDGMTFIAGELVEGETLRQYFERARDRELESPGLSAAAIEGLIRPVCAALDYASDKTLHLNLKPENVLIGPSGAIKVTDFGLEDVVTVIPRGRSRAMSEQRRFISPEQIRRARNLTLGQDPIDGRADQYAIAALVYFLATGDVPVADAVDLAARRPDLPAPMTKAVRRALSAAPDGRFDTISALVQALFTRPRPWARAIYVTASVIALTIMAGLVIWANKPDLLDRVLPRVMHWGGADAERQQALGLQERTESLKERLQTAERDLRQRLRDAQTEVDIRTQTVGTGAAGAAALAEAKTMRAMLTDLSGLAIPRVFNNADILNAYNLLGLAQQHILAGRYRDAIVTLSNAENTMTTHLADWRAAEAWARERHKLAPESVKSAVGGTGLSHTWESLNAERRRFASSVDQGMVLIPAGSFVMGDLLGDGSKAELPVHRVTVDAFKLGRTPVTRAEYTACVAANACPAAAGAAQDGDKASNLPMTGINWFEAQEYVAWLRLRTGEDYRLPSEAEWEYAARAGATSAYPWGTEIGQNRANCANCGSAWDRSAAAPVASFAPNAFGLYDVVGNVWQWTADCWYRDYSTAPANGGAREELGCPRRVLRGGSWDNDAWMARMSYRGGAPATLRQDINGFRIAKSVE